MTMLLIAQSVATALIAAWLVTGVWDNIRHPENNETYTAEVMEMTRMKAAYPAEYARIAHRAITNRSLQKMAFRIVVAAELLGAVLLVLGAALLALAVLGIVTQGFALGVALLGTTVFTAVWGGFLVVGNYFCYWFCHEGAQNTHYQMTLWGLGTLILLAQ
ncbi:MAG: DUF2165 family protein [Pseudomonadota bacterium]